MTAAETTNKRKRETGNDNDDEDTEAPKVLKAADTGGDFAVALSDTRQVRVSDFKGTLYVSIREWYDKAGTQAPGKGIHLPLSQWHDLTASLDAIQAAVSDSNMDYLCKLSQNRQLSLKQFKGKLQVCLSRCMCVIALNLIRSSANCIAFALTKLPDCMQLVACNL